MRRSLPRPAAAPNVVQVQPFLHDLLMVAGIVVLVLLPLIIKPLAKRRDEELPSGERREGERRAHEARLRRRAFRHQLLRTRRSARYAASTSAIPNSRPPRNWLLTHASDEIAHLNLTDQEVIGTVKAVFPQVKFSPPPAAS
jgi:hypothetical protein